MLTFPNSKINIGLYITGKRPDGFHNLESIFYPVNYHDALEIIPADNFSFEYKGMAIVGKDDDNLCIKAYHLLKEKFDLPPVKIFLYKNIPMGAGLGGGSSDRTHCLKMLDKIFTLNLTAGALGEYAAQLGSDCPFFINNVPAYIEGRGEKMKAIKLDLSGYHITIIHPGIHISTREAFQNIKYEKPGIPLEEMIHAPIEKWQATIKNAFEENAFKTYPVLKKIKESLLDSGAAYASMSGSGSAIYAISRQILNVQEVFENSIIWKAEFNSIDPLSS